MLAVWTDVPYHFSESMMLSGHKQPETLMKWLLTVLLTPYSIFGNNLVVALSFSFFLLSSRPVTPRTGWCCLIKETVEGKVGSQTVRGCNIYRTSLIFGCSSTTLIFQLPYLWSFPDIHEHVRAAFKCIVSLQELFVVSIESISGIALLKIARNQSYSTCCAC